MLKLAATVLILCMFIALSTLVLLDGSLDPSDWTAAGGILVAVNLVLLALRGIWRSSPKVVEGLYWPTLTAAGLLGLSGLATILDTLRLGRERGEMDVYFLGVGAFIVLVCLLTAFTLRPRRLSS